MREHSRHRDGRHLRHPTDSEVEKCAAFERRLRYLRHVLDNPLGTYDSALARLAFPVMNKSDRVVAYVGL